FVAFGPDDDRYSLVLAGVFFPLFLCLDDPAPDLNLDFVGGPERWQVALFDLVSEELSKLLDARLSAKRYLRPTQASVSHTLHQVPPSVVLRFVEVVHGSP